MYIVSEMKNFSYSIDNFLILRINVLLIVLQRQLGFSKFLF